MHKELLLWWVWWWRHRVTPGTLIEENKNLHSNSYLCTVVTVPGHANVGVAYADMSTGQLGVLSVDGVDPDLPVLFYFQTHFPNSLPLT